MNYFDYCLRFDTQEAAQSVLGTLTYTDPETGDSQEVTGSAAYTAVDELGVLYENGSELPGWHVNVRHTAACPELEPYQVFPNTPTRVWA